MNGDGSSRDGRGRGSRDYRRDDRDDRRERDRGERHRDHRRSRSPYSRGSRRRDDEDSYAASRSHREREREDRYGGGRRGADREWDRDRGSSRRDARRDDDDRFSRRSERDHFDDRRRGGRDRHDDGGHGRRERQRSDSPPARKREPTPDLTNVVSVLDRKRRLTQWDIKPPGYESVTAEQAKLSGMFLLPGAPRQPNQQRDQHRGGGGGHHGGGGGGGGGGSGGGGPGGDQHSDSPSRLQNTLNQPQAGSASGASLKPSNSRQSKRLLVGNLPSSVTEDSIVGFFNLQLNGLNVIESTDPCVAAQLSNDKSLATIEFREPADATVALAMDGQSMEAEDAGGRPLEIRRPRDYIVPAVVDEPASEPGVVSNIVPDTPNKLSISNMPAYLTEEQVTELLGSFGELKAFVLVRDRGTEESRGIAFCEYIDPAATEVALQGLNNMDLGDRKIRVQRASKGFTQVAGVEMGVAAMSMLAGTTSTESDESPVLQLLNMVTAEELVDNDEYEEIMEDVQEECSKFGPIKEIKIPRPSGGSRQSAGVGKIFVKYQDKESTKKALQALAGRKFADRTVVATFFPDESFETSSW